MSGLLVFLLPAALAAPLDASVDAALERSPSIAAARAVAEGAGARVREVRGLLLPGLDAELGAALQNEITFSVNMDLSSLGVIGLPEIDIPPTTVQPSQQLLGRVELVQPIVAPGAWAALRAAREGEALSRSQVEAAASTLTGYVVEAWYASARAHVLRDGAARGLSVAEEALEISRSLVEVGVATEDDVLDARRAVSTARSRVASAEAASAAADAALQVLTGLSGGADPLGEAPELPDLQALLRQLETPALAAAEQQVALADAAVGAARGPALPVLGLKGMVSVVDPAPDIAEPVNWQLMLGLQAPLYHGGQVGAQVDSARAGAEAARAAERAARESAEIAVLRAHGELAAALAAIAEQEEALALARQRVEHSQLRLNDGAGTLLALRVAQGEQIAAEIGRALAICDAARAADQLQLAVSGAL